MQVNENIFLNYSLFMDLHVIKECCKGVRIVYIKYCDMKQGERKFLFALLE